MLFIIKQTALPIRLRIDSLSLSLRFGFCFDASLIQYLTLLAIASYKVSYVCNNSCGSDRSSTSTTDAFLDF